MNAQQAKALYDESNIKTKERIVKYTIEKENEIRKNIERSAKHGANFITVENYDIETLCLIFEKDGFCVSYRHPLSNSATISWA